MAIDKQEVEKLKANLSPSSEVLTPDSEGYAESIKRWSSAAEKPAVSLLVQLKWKIHHFTEHSNENLGSSCPSCNGRRCLESNSVQQNQQA